MTLRSGAGASRREALHALFALAVVGGAVPAWAQQDFGKIIIVSRERVLRESDIAQRLRQAELALTAQLQAAVDAAKTALDAEEVELTKLRAELEPDEFEARAAAFDQQVRQVRRETQERAAALQRGFQEARAQLVGTLPRVLEDLRIESGAAIVLSADQVLAAGQGIDRTGRAIEMFNALGGSVEIPNLDLTLPLITAPDIGAQGGEQQQ